MQLYLDFPVGVEEQAVYESHDMLANTHTTVVHQWHHLGHQPKVIQGVLQLFDFQQITAIYMALLHS